MRKQDWDDFRVVLAVARAGSFSRAAPLLDVNETTVVRRVQQAEGRLGMRLFDRDQGRARPTEAGRQLVLHAERLESLTADAAEAMRAVSGQVAGWVRIACPPLFASRVLAPALAELTRQHPLLQVELLSETGPAASLRREADVALRFARPPEGVRWVARRVGEVRYGVYAAREHGPGPLPWASFEAGCGDPAAHDWLAVQLQRSGQAAARVQVNDGESLLACVQAGTAQALLPEAIAQRIPGLTRLPQPGGDAVGQLWLSAHAEQRQVDRIRATLEWVARHCGGHAPAPVRHEVSDGRLSYA